MKKIVPVLLAALLLTGCANTPEPTAETTTQASQPAQPPVTLLSGTEGSITTYTLDSGSCAGMLMLGTSRALLTTDGEMYLLSGDELTVTNRQDLDCDFSSDDPSIVVMGDQLSFYDRNRGAYVTIGKNLTEISARTIQDEITAGPIMSPDLTAIYYCTADGIRAMDTATGNSRLLRKEHETIVSLDGLMFDGSILRYTRGLEGGQTQTFFVRTSDGSQAYFADLDGKLVTWGDHFAAVMHMELPLTEERQILTGTAGGDVRRLAVEDNWNTALFPGGGMLLLQTAVGDGVRAELYDLTTGTLAAQTEFQRQGTFPYGWMDGDQLWLWDGMSSSFCRWDTAGCNAGSASWLTTRYTLSSPDTAAVEACNARAQALGEKYGLTLRLTEGDNRVTGVDYSGYPDYRPGQYQAALQALEQILARFPEGFFKELNITVELVDEFDPNEGVLPGTGSLTVGQERLIRVSICRDMEAIFYHELFHGLELYIQSQTNELGKWERCNPKGFEYAESFSAYECGELKNSEYIGSFADDYCLVSAREDRAQTFMYAMLEGNESVFAQEDVREKLEILCQAIREAYDYDEDEVSALPWGAYLNAD